MVAEDIVQNLFIQFWHTQKLGEISYIEPYLLRATKFKSIDYLRTKNYQKTIPLEECAIAVSYTHLTLPTIYSV